MSNEHITDERLAEVLTEAYGSPEWTMADVRAARAVEAASLALRPAAQPAPAVPAGMQLTPVAIRKRTTVRPKGQTPHFIGKEWHYYEYSLSLYEDLLKRAKFFQGDDVERHETEVEILYTSTNAPAAPDRAPMTDELEQALEMLVEQCNQDAVFSGAQAVIHAEAVLERLYKSRTGITSPSNQPTRTE